ncbi:acyl carrier protein [Streptomyces sp. BG9H]|uniref:Acyl carrier protein n=1 Tax=Streptomyces anatolicus TaxID=2675858 RepID=A0ABS6YF06_9ACTN|nr:acyl carrier protein [Streptomyces anatolicus]MBW5419992.1 acyl carrier protein [Streptomyces anatolicus]
MSPEHMTLQQFRELPRAELAEEMEQLLVSQFRATLLMDDAEELPLDISYFDLGLTSLKLTEMRRTLEGILDLSINANVLFNEPTVGRLLDYLVDAVSDPSHAVTGAIPSTN